MTRLTAPVIKVSFRRADLPTAQPGTAIAERREPVVDSPTSTGGVYEPDVPGMVSLQDPGASVIATEVEMVGVRQRYGSVDEDAPMSMDANVQSIERLRAGRRWRGSGCR